MIQYELVPNISQETSININENTYLFRFKLGKQFVFCDCTKNDQVQFLGRIISVDTPLIDDFYFLDEEEKAEDPEPIGFGDRWVLIWIK